MKIYKEQILNTLHDSGWELIDIIEGCDWWAEEHWKIQSIKQCWGLIIFIHFKYDPLGSGLARNNSVLTIEATSDFNHVLYDDKDVIAEMYLQKGKFNENVAAFINAISSYRDNHSRNKHW